MNLPNLPESPPKPPRLCDSVRLDAAGFWEIVIQPYDHIVSSGGPEEMLSVLLKVGAANAMAEIAVFAVAFASFALFLPAVRGARYAFQAAAQLRSGDIIGARVAGSVGSPR